MTNRSAHLADNAAHLPIHSYGRGAEPEPMTMQEKVKLFGSCTAWFFTRKGHLKAYNATNTKGLVVYHANRYHACGRALAEAMQFPCPFDLPDAYFKDDETALAWRVERNRLMWEDITFYSRAEKDKVGFVRPL